MYSDNNSNLGYKQVIQNINNPLQFQFYYEKYPLLSNFDNKSPIQTCPSDQIQKQLNFGPQQQDQLFDIQQYHVLKLRKSQLYQNSIQDYDKAVSQYLQKSLNLQLIQSCNLRFSSVPGFENLDFIKKQCFQTIQEYNKLETVDQKIPQKFQKQNSLFYKFLEQITYLSFQQINFQLIHLINAMYNFINNNFSQSQQNQVDSFLNSLTEDAFLKFINFKTICSQTKINNFKETFKVFLKNIYHIIDNIFRYQQSEDYEQNGSYQDVVDQTKLLLSKRDIIDSSDGQESQFVFAHSKKKIKLS